MEDIQYVRSVSTGDFNVYLTTRDSTLSSFPQWYNTNIVQIQAGFKRYAPYASLIESVMWISLSEMLCFSMNCEELWPSSSFIITSVFTPPEGNSGQI